MYRKDDDPLRLSGVFHDRYRILRCIKAGGMGAVYEVMHVETHRRCALKVMLPSMVADPEMRARFRREATVTAEIESEHLVLVLDAGVDADTGVPFIVMELLKGEELGDMLARRGPLPPAEVVDLMWQLSRGLERTHGAGIVHRDLKPANLFITLSDDGSPRVKVLDFGIAKVVASGADAGQTRAMMGTPYYMAPEQISGQASIGPAADLYAAGHIAYTLLTGEAYWKRDRGPDGVYGLLLKVMSGLSEPASQRAAARGVILPPSFDAWFARATAVSPEFRFARASDLVGALAETLALSGSPSPLRALPPRGEDSKTLPSAAGVRSFAAAVAVAEPAQRAEKRAMWVLFCSLLVGLATVIFRVGVYSRAPSTEEPARPPAAASAPAPSFPADSGLLAAPPPDAAPPAPPSISVPAASAKTTPTGVRVRVSPPPRSLAKEPPAPVNREPVLD